MQNKLAHEYYHMPYHKLCKSRQRIIDRMCDQRRSETEPVAERELLTRSEAPEQAAQ